MQPGMILSPSSLAPVFFHSFPDHILVRASITLCHDHTPFRVLGLICYQHTRTMTKRKFPLWCIYVRSVLLEKLDECRIMNRINNEMKGSRDEQAEPSAV